MVSEGRAVAAARSSALAASPMEFPVSPRQVTEALTAIAFAIAVAPASPILLAPNLQNTSRSGDGQESFVKKRQVGQGMVRRVSSESERTPTFSTRR